MQRTFKKSILPAALSCGCAALLGISSTVSAATHLSLTGSHTDANAGYQQVESGGLSAGVAFDVGDYIRLGYTHAQQLQASKGYNCDDKTKTTTDPKTGEPSACPTFQSKSHVWSHSVDLTLILYAGDVFTPYISAGAGPKFYEIESREGEEELKKDRGAYPNPNGAVGLAIRLNQKFSLKLSYALSMGIKKEPTKEAEPTVDAHAQVGIQYSL